jgi:hypothetical protein
MHSRASRLIPGQPGTSRSEECDRKILLASAGRWAGFTLALARWFGDQPAQAENGQVIIRLSGRANSRLGLAWRSENLMTAG